MDAIEKKIDTEAIRRCSTKEKWLTDFGVSCFEDGAQWMREELTRWHYTKDELPDDNNFVEAVIEVDGAPLLIIAYRDSFGWWVRPTPTDSWCGCPYDIINWRYVHDPYSEKGGEE